MGKISVVINTLNEEENIGRVMKSVKDLADEIVVCDMHSDDETVAIAKNYGARVYKHQKVGYVEPARNFAIDKASGEWLLVLDADEEVPETLARKLKDLAARSLADYYRLPRKNIIFGKWIKHSRWWPDYNIRFFKKGTVKWSEVIHSVPETRGVGADLEAVEENAIIHHHYDSVEQYIERLNRYTTFHAELRLQDGYEFKWMDLIRKPTSEFLSRYFQGEGYKDGLHGLALASLQAFSELVLYLKVWQKTKFMQKDISVDSVIDELREAQHELSYWQADTLLKEVGGLKHRIKRKLKLP